MSTDTHQAAPPEAGSQSWLARLKQLARTSLKVLDRNDTVRDRAVAAWAKTLPDGSAVLDVGAGMCKYAPLFAHCRYIAQDAPDVDYALPGTTILRSDISAIPLPPGSVDAVLCTEVLEHVERPLDALTEFARLLRPDGRLFLTVPAACRVHRVPTHYYGGFAPDFFERSLPSRGLRLEKLQPIGNWSQFMAQELGRMPSIVRDHSSLPTGIRQLISIAIWPAFRVAVPTLLLAFSRLDTSDDLQLGWIALARKA